MVDAAVRLLSLCNQLARSSRSVTLDFRIVGPGRLDAHGWARWMGLPVGRTLVSLSKSDKTEAR